MWRVVAEYSQVRWTQALVVSDQLNVSLSPGLDSYVLKQDT